MGPRQPSLYSARFLKIVLFTFLGCMFYGMVALPTKLPPPPSWSPPPLRCHRHAAAAYAAAVLPTPPMPRSHQAAASTAKLDAPLRCHRASAATTVPFVSIVIFVAVIVAVSVILVDC